METRYISLDDAIQCANDLSVDLLNDGLDSASYGAQAVAEWLKDIPAAAVVEKTEWDKLMFLVDAANQILEAAKWIPVDERLPEEGEFVLIYVGEIQVARLEKGISIADRNRMKEGVIADPIVGYSDWDKRPVKRSDVFKRCDEQGNNKVSYIWIANGGPMQWFGQYATHWMPLPQPPNEGGGKDE